MTKEYVEMLQERLAKIEEEKSTILKLLDIWGEKRGALSLPFKDEIKSSQSFSISGRIIDAVVELIHKTGRPVKNSEIMEYMKEKQLPIGNAENPERMLAAILYNETKKKDARLKKAARGYFEIRQ